MNKPETESKRNKIGSSTRQVMAQIAKMATTEELEEELKRCVQAMKSSSPFHPDMQVAASYTLNSDIKRAVEAELQTRAAK